MIKVHLGCGPNLLPGWINTDLHPHSGAIFLDVRRGFPFEPDSVDFIFNEHMIEHLSFEDGHRMLESCFRVLKPGGRIRTSTPDLNFLVGLLNGDHPDYVCWAHGIFTPGLPLRAESVVNNFVRAWGHQFIYTKQMLMDVLAELGFRDIRYDLLIGESDVPEFRNLENPTRMPPGFLQLETMTIEASK